MDETYQKLLELSKKATLYRGIAQLLDWDQETYMPKKAIEYRSAQVELIAKQLHQAETSEEYTKALGTLIDIETGSILKHDLTEPQKAALKRWHRDYCLAVKFPTAFVEEFARVTSQATHVWAQAKEKSDFSIFAPLLTKIVELSRKKADFLGYKDHPYDALVDQFEPHMTTAVLTPLFERLKIPLSTLIKKIQTRPRPNDAFLHQDFPHDAQLLFGKQVLSAMGFHKSFSRLDESAHPFCIGVHPFDTRMTTRILPNNPMSNIFACIHEGGHGLYHSNLPFEHFGSPLSESASLGIDESQSRMWETIIGHSLPFWTHFFPLLQKTFPDHLNQVNLEEFYRAINLSAPSLIRIESDEVTYNLHIMIRFEIEKALIEGTLETKDLPSTWNSMIQKHLGIVPKSDSAGCLQDIHWSLGAIGYFPTYTLGNLYSAQFFETFTEQNQNWKEKLARGELKFIGEWTKKEIHQYGRQYLPNELCEKITGKPLSEKPLLHYLETKYSALYHL